MFVTVENLQLEIDEFSVTKRKMYYSAHTKATTTTEKEVLSLQQENVKLISRLLVFLFLTIT